MKIAVLSDTHIPRNANRIPAALLKKLADVDMIIHVGDLTEYSVIEELSSVARTVAVHGNMDSIEVRKKLPEKQVIEAEGYRIGICHGGGAPASLLERVRRRFNGEQLDVIVFGHSHTPYSEVIDGVLFFNPGSATDDVNGVPTYGLLELDDKITPHILTY